MSAGLGASIPPGLKALVVEDSAATRRIFRQQLRSLGIDSAEEPDGAAALGRLEREIGEFAVVYSDISMPRMDGFELCYRLHQAPWYDGTPLVMVSTQSDAGNVIRALKLGAEDYLPKPFDVQSLARITRRVLHHG
jgi:two-component system chemotaxis response regulator CheY